MMDQFLAEMDIPVKTSALRVKMAKTNSSIYGANYHLSQFSPQAISNLAGLELGNNPNARKALLRFLHAINLPTENMGILLQAESQAISTKNTFANNISSVNQSIAHLI
jgi:hypothetical protein